MLRRASLPGREPYQQVLAEVADAHGIARADFAAIFNNEGRRLDISPGCRHT